MERNLADDVPANHHSAPLLQRTSAASAAPIPNSNATIELLLRKRRIRSQRVCQPCRMRKVKCTYETPCQTCSERGYPELCHYAADEPKKRFRTGRSSSSRPGLDDGERSPPSGAELSEVHSRITAVYNMVHDLREEIRSLRAGLHGGAVNGLIAPTANPSLNAHSKRGVPGSDVVRVMSARNGLNGSAVFLGGNSVPAMVAALADDSNTTGAVQDILGQSILPVFCLDNESATYPFVDLWGIPHGSFKRIELLSKLLPATDADCMQTFSQYRDAAHVIYPGIVDLVQFESDLLAFLRHRSREPLIVAADALLEQEVYGKDLHWLGLFFAALASGTQCSSLPRKERQMKSQVYVCCAYECLRIMNYISRATLSSIQTLLVLGNVLSNNMNAGVAWSLLGLTIRLAQTLGLHYDGPSSNPGLAQTTRSNIWWQIVWQDSLLSVTFDRSSPTSIVADYPQAATTSKLSYVDSMRRLCKIGLDIVQQRAVLRPPEEQFRRTVQWRDWLRDDMQQAKPHLVEVSSCRTIREQLEYWNLYMHRSYILSELSRSSLRSQQDSKTDKEPDRSMRTLCIESLANTVEAFLGLQNITDFASQSWAAVHRSLSSALLLSILGEPTRSKRVQSLVVRLVAVMSDVISTLDASERSAPLTRSVAVLQKFSLHQQSTGQEPHSDTFRSANLHDLEDLPGTALSQSSALLPSPATSSDSEHSPYSVINSIFWGAQNSNPLEQQGILNW